MSMHRGARNRAKEKVWLGQDAASVRADKHGNVAQPIERGVSTPEVAGSIPAVSASLKQLEKIAHKTAQAAQFARAKAEGTEERWSPPRRIPLVSRGQKQRSKISAKSLKELLGDQHWDKVGRVHYLLTLLRAKQKISDCNVLPGYLHELDPLEVMIMAEEMDLEKMTIHNFWELLGEAA